jgi:hypothetical protein
MCVCICICMRIYIYIFCRYLRFQELEETVNSNKFLDINPLVSYKSVLSDIVLTCRKNFEILPLVPLPWNYYCSYTLHMICLWVGFSDSCSNLSLVQELVCTSNHFSGSIICCCWLTSSFPLQYLTVTKLYPL